MKNSKFTPTNIFALALRIYIQINILKNKQIEEEIYLFYASID
jgi:hypothetical protein